MINQRAVGDGNLTGSPQKTCNADNADIQGVCPFFRAAKQAKIGTDSRPLKIDLTKSENHTLTEGFDKCQKIVLFFSSKDNEVPKMGNVTFISNPEATTWFGIAHKLSDLGDHVLGRLPSIQSDDQQWPEKLAFSCLASKCSMDFHALLLLLENGFTDSAALLARSVLEACVTMLYIEKEPATRGKEFWSFECQQLVDIWHKTLKGTTKFVPSDETTNKLGEWQEFIDSEKQPGKERLILPNPGNMVQELSEELQKLYRLEHKQYDGIAHCLPFHLGLLYTTRTKSEVTVGRNEESMDPTEFLRTPCNFFWAGLNCLNTNFYLQADQELDCICTEMAVP